MAMVEVASKKLSTEHFVSAKKKVQKRLQFWNPYHLSEDLTKNDCIYGWKL